LKSCFRLVINYIVTDFYQRKTVYIVPDILGVDGTVELSNFPSTCGLYGTLEKLIPLCLFAVRAINRGSVDAVI
jgi:hypothetical protein